MEPALHQRDKDLSRNSERKGEKARNHSTSPKGIAELVVERSTSSDVSVESLVSSIQQELGYSRDRVLSRIMELNEEKKITLIESKPYDSLTSYTFSPYSLWFWAALLATLASLGLIFVTSGIAIYLRYMFGGLLILFLPGYSLLELLYSKKGELDGLTRLALSIGLSLALVPLTGLVLNYTPFGIRLIPVTLSLTLLVAILLVAALSRKYSYYKLSRNV